MRHIFALTLCGLIPLLTVGCRGHSIALAEGFYSYDRKAVVAFLKENHIQGSPSWIRRSATGEKIYVLLYDKSHSDGYRLLIVEENSIKVGTVPGINACFNGRDEMVAWSRDLKEGISFRNGFLLHLPQFAYFDVAQSGDYFVVGETSNHTWVGSTEKPDAPELVATDFRGRSIFSTSAGLVVTGYAERDGKSTGSCIFLKRDEEDGSFAITKTLDFPSFGGVVEVSPDGRALVLQGRSELFAGWYLYEVATGDIQRLGVSTQYGFFLNSDLLVGKKKLLILEDF